MNRSIKLLFLIATLLAVGCSSVPGPVERYSDNRRVIDTTLFNMSMETRRQIIKDEIEYGWCDKNASFSRSRFPLDLEELWYLDGQEYYEKKIRWLKEKNFLYSDTLVSLYRRILVEIDLQEKHHIHRSIYK